MWKKNFKCFQHWLDRVSHFRYVECNCFSLQLIDMRIYVQNTCSLVLFINSSFLSSEAYYPVIVWIYCDKRETSNSAHPLAAITWQVGQIRGRSRLFSASSTRAPQKWFDWKLFWTSRLRVRVLRQMHQSIGEAQHEICHNSLNNRPILIICIRYWKPLILLSSTVLLIYKTIAKMRPSDICSCYCQQPSRCLHHISFWNLSNEKQNKRALQWSLTLDSRCAGKFEDKMAKMRGGQAQEQAAWDMTAAPIITHPKS